jgi:hypothetical protein
MDLNKLPPELEFDFLNVEVVNPSFCTQPPISARVFFLGEKKTRNTKIAFIGLGRFFLLPAKNFGLFELPHSSPAQITSHSKP